MTTTASRVSHDDEEVRTGGSDGPLVGAETVLRRLRLLPLRVLPPVVTRA